MLHVTNSKKVEKRETIDIYLFKLNYKGTRTSFVQSCVQLCIYSKLTMKASERCQSSSSGIFNNHDQILFLFLMCYC